MKSLKEIGYVNVGMLITNIAGTAESIITKVIIPSTKEELTMALIPADTDLVLELDGGPYLYTDIGWNILDEGILVVNSELFTQQIVH